MSVGTVTGRNSLRSDLNRIMPGQLGSIKMPVYVVPPPVDIPHSVHGFLNHWQPDGAIFVESELWPNMIYEVACQKITLNESSCERQKQLVRLPLALVNGRLSKHSFKRWQYLDPGRYLLGGLLSQFDCLIAQS